MIKEYLFPPNDAAPEFYFLFTFLFFFLVFLESFIFILLFFFLVFLKRGDAR